jgi:hypothetical protein
VKLPFSRPRAENGSGVDQHRIPTDISEEIRREIADPFRITDVESFRMTDPDSLRMADCPAYF